jgi:hypothetical protein
MGSIKNLIVLLCSAAQYQAVLDAVSICDCSPSVLRANRIKDQLIAQSFICLRSCLEIIRVQLSELHHRGCKLSSCEIECTSTLSMYLRLYLDEVSRVIFKKENLKGSRAWWLSTFYSLCIQSCVRKMLIAIIEGYASEADGANLLSAKQYLHLALKLFQSSSRGYDPLVLTWTDDFKHLFSAEESPRAEHYRLAQTAVGQSSWQSSKIDSSRDYLNRIFETDGIYDAQA